jgi:hypothetical protein
MGKREVSRKRILACRPMSPMPCELKLKVLLSRGSSTFPTKSGSTVPETMRKGAVTPISRTPNRPRAACSVGLMMFSTRYSALPASYPVPANGPPSRVRTR